MSEAILRIGTLAVAFALLMGPMSAFVSESEAISVTVVQNIPESGDMPGPMLTPFSESSIGEEIFIKDPVTVMVVCTNPSKVAQALSGIPYRGFLSQRESGEIISPVLQIPRYAIDILEATEGVLAIMDYGAMLRSDRVDAESVLLGGSDQNAISSIFDTKQHYGSEAWSKGFTGEGITVAVTEFGIDFSQPDIMDTQARVTDAASPYYGWPIVFDSTSLTSYISSDGNTTGTWYVDTSTECELNYTENYDMNINTEVEWDALTGYSNSWQPKPAGDAESLVLSGLTPGKPYVFAIRATDEAGNIAPLSNSPTATSKVDDIAPSQITTLVATPGVDHETVELSWTATGDDGATGSASSYLIRYSDLPIANVHCFRHLSSEITNAIVPAASGAAENFLVIDMPAGRTFYFAVVSLDEAGNWGEVSNTVSATVTEDAAKPQTISGLTATPVDAPHSGVILDWTAPRDEGATGSSCLRYEGRFSATPIVTENDWDMAYQIPQASLPTPGTPGTPQTATVTTGLDDPTLVSIDNETVYGPATGGETGPWYLDNIDAIGLNLYRQYDNAGSWELQNLVQGTEYTFNASNGEINLIGWAGATTYIEDEIAFTETTELDNENAKFFLAHANINDVTLYLDSSAYGITEWYKFEFFDCNYSTGWVEITEFPLYNDEIVHAYYNYSDMTTSLQAGDSLLAYYNYSSMNPVFFALRGFDELGRAGDIASVSSMVAIDETAPAQITTINAATGILHGMVYLNLTSVGDDGTTGSAKRYVVRYSSSPITNDAEFDAATDWMYADPNYVGMNQYLRWPSPKIAGQAETYQFGYLPEVPYFSLTNPTYFAVKVMDDAGNLGPLSASVSAIACNDVTLPGTVSTLTAVAGEKHGTVLLSWTAVGDDGASGSLYGNPPYDVKWSTSVIDTVEKFNLAIGTAIDAAKTPGQTMTLTVTGLEIGLPYYFSVRARDDALLQSNLPVNASAVPRNDIILPSAISLVTATGDHNGQVKLTFTAPGNDAAAGTADAYEVRYKEYIPSGQFIQHGFSQVGILNISYEPYYYNVTGITSQSGIYRIGTHVDQNLATYMNGNTSMGLVNYSAVLVVDSATANVYDTVYVDLDDDMDFSDEKACTKGDEASYSDTDGNGIPDVSGGMIYFIGSATLVPNEALTVLGGGGYAISAHGNVINNSWSVYQNGNALADGKYSVTMNRTGYLNISFTPALASATGVTLKYEHHGLALPYSERYAARYSMDNVIPGNGDLVAFMGEFGLDSSFGTSMASSIVGQGYLPLLDDTTIRPVVGMAPDAKIISVVDMGFDGIIFALEGYDGIPMTGDEANVVSSSMSSSTVYVSGLDFASNFMDWLVTTYSGGTSSIVVTAGDNGPGYGTVSSPGSAYGVITAGLATDLSYRAIAEVYENGPQAMFGDVVAISGRGPTVAGNPKPDIVAAGAYFGFVSQPLYMPEATPLAPYNNLVELWMYGQGLTSAVASAGVALVYQAYGLGHAGNMPQGSTVHEILMSGADDLSFDIFSQGAGQLNASKAVDIAYNSDGVSVSPFNWVPGDFQGVRYETYVKLVSAETPTDYLSETFTVVNHGSSSEDVTVQPEILSKIGEVVTTVTTTLDNPHENLIINETGLYYRDGRILQLMDPSLWNDAELLRVTAYNENDTGYWLELFAWNDSNENGMADQDKDPDPYPGAVAWGERNRMQMSTIYTNKHEVTVQNPAGRVGDGILIWIRSTGGPAYDCKWVVKAEAYAKGAWDMISVDDSLLTIPGKSSGTFTATVDRAKALAAGPGTYDGAISVGGALIPVVINVPMIPGAEELEPTTYSVTDEIAETSYNSTRTVTNETSVSKAKASNMTFYLKHRNIIQLSKVVYNGTNNQWYELPTDKYSVNLATGLVTLTLIPTDIKTDASFHTWYTYTEADVALAHSNIIPGSMTVYKDGVMTSQYGSVNSALIFKNRNDFVGEELVNATGGETAANLANSGGTELISGVTVYLNGTAMWLGTDYTVNTTTGAVAFMAPLKPGMLVTADYYTYDPTITTLMLPNTEISPGRKDISNPNGYLIYIDGVAVNDLVVTVNLVTGELTFTDPVPPGAIIIADYKYGSYLPDYSLGVIDFVIEPALGVNITANYDYYYSEHPYVHGYMYGGCDGSGTGKGGDWRFYYTTLANGPLNRDPNNKMAIDMTWVRAGTDIDSFLFTDTYLSTPSVGNGAFNVSRYGPNLLTNSGGSTESSALFTASGGASDFALVPPTPGLNVLALHNVRFNGTMDLEAPTGKLGRMTISQDNIDIVTNSLAGEKTIYAYSSLDWDGKLSGVAAGPSAPTQYKDMLVYQDEDDWTLFETFEEQLASGNTSIYLTLKDCLIFDVHVYGHTDTYTREGSFNDVGDLDLGIFLDENGDGITQEEEFFAMCADADADEQVKLVGPPDGNYIIRVFGFTLKKVPAHYDIDITNVQGLGFGVEGEGEDLTPDNPDQWKSATPQPAFTQSSLTLSYNLASAKDGITLQGALYLGPGEAPYAMLMPIELRYDSIPPEVNSVAPLDGTTMKATQPTVTVGFADSMGEIVHDDARLFLDGADVTTRTSISIELVDDDEAPVKGYPQGTMTFIPTSPLSEGLHTVVATMGDLAGNVKSVSWSFVVDSSAPELALDSEFAAATYTNTNTYLITGTAEKGCSLNVIGAQVRKLTQADDGRFSALVVLDSGLNLIQITAIDSANNKAVTSCVIHYDSETPTFGTVQFLGGDMTNSQYTVMTGKLDKTGSMTVNGMAVIVLSDGSFNKTLSLVEGRNTFHLEFTDLAGNTAESWQNVTRDSVAPVLTITPTESSVTNQSFTITGNVEAGANVYVNGKPVEISTRQAAGSFSYLVILSPGINNLVIEARDSVGNVAEARLTVEYDSATADSGTNYAAIGMMVALFVVGLVLGIILAVMFLGGRKEEQPEEEVAPEGEIPVEGELPTDELSESSEEPLEPATDDSLEVNSEELEPIPAEESIPEAMPEEPIEPETEEIIPEEVPAIEEAPVEEDPRVTKLTEAYKSGRISKELYEKNLAKFREQK